MKTFVKIFFGLGLSCLIVMPTNAANRGYNVEGIFYLCDDESGGMWKLKIWDDSAQLSKSSVNLYLDSRLMTSFQNPEEKLFISKLKYGALQMSLRPDVLRGAQKVTIPYNSDVKSGNLFCTRSAWTNRDF